MIKALVGKAVDDSIVEILPPVVDRSVTIALITTRELVLKDFAHDRDYTKVMEASDLIVQNLAGSLALVTCREPLRMSLTNNIKKALDAHFRSEGVEIRPGTPPTRRRSRRSSVRTTSLRSPSSSAARTSSSAASSSRWR